MIYSLDSKYYQFRWNSDNNRYSLLSKEQDDLILENSPIDMVYFQNGQRKNIVIDSQKKQIETHQFTEKNIGKTWQINIEGEVSRGEICYRMTFALMENAPFLLLKIKLYNRSGEAINVDQFDMLRVANKLEAGDLHFSSAQIQEPAFFSNGWQSWSLSAAYGSKDKARVTRLGPITEPMVYNTGTPIPKKAGRFSSDFWAVLGDRKNKRGMILGFLSQKEQFGTIEAVLSDEIQLTCWANGDLVRVDPGKSLETDWAVISMINLAEPDPTGPFLELVARYHQIHLPDKVFTGWCSWYEYYTGITPEIIRENIMEISSIKDQLPVDVVQVDDGFEAQVGDWLDFKPAFSEGVANLAKDIRENGMLPGLWLAPFIVHPKAQICRDHPDWILKNKKGQKRINAGFGWGTLTTALDLTQPEVLDHVGQIVKTAVEKWKYPYLKLDFLYAGALPGAHHDPTLTRAQILRKGMETIRQAVGKDTFLLGCGAPLGSVLGLVDGMRIGADVAGSWAPKFSGIGLFFNREPFIPSARNSIQNILTRVPYHQRWWINDPDCLMIRPDTELSLEEVQTLATVIGLSGGMMVVSDKMTSIDPDRLRIAQVLLPLMTNRPRVLDWFDQTTPQKIRKDLNGPGGDWSLIAWFNWSDQKVQACIKREDFNLDVENYWVRSFWDGAVRRAGVNMELFQACVPAHAGLLLAVKKDKGQEPVYLGSNLHISQGMEVDFWEFKKDRLSFIINTRIDGILDIYIPWIPKQVEGEGVGAIPYKTIGNGIYQLSVLHEYSGKKITIE